MSMEIIFDGEIKCKDGKRRRIELKFKTAKAYNEFIEMNDEIIFVGGFASIKRV